MTFLIALAIGLTVVYFSDEILQAVGAVFCASLKAGCFVIGVIGVTGVVWILIEHFSGRDFSAG